MRRNCIICAKDFYLKPSRAHERKCCSDACRAIWQRGENNPNFRGGTTKKILRKCVDCGHEKIVSVKSTDNPQRCIECEKKHRYGENNSRWKGGVTPLNKLIRNSQAYQQWRKQIFERDNYTCVFCGQHGGQLHADHIKSFSGHPKLRMDMDNGRTLCRSCHEQTPTYRRGCKAELPNHGHPALDVTTHVRS